MNPSNRDTLVTVLRRAIREHQAGQLAQAEGLYRQILTHRPNQADALHFLGVIAYQQGRHEAAVDLIRRSLAVRPSYIDAYSNLGNALKSLGLFSEAIDAYRQAIALDPNLAEAHNNLGIAMRELGRLDEAIAAYRQAIVLKPDYAHAFCNLGVVLQDKGNLDEAIGAFQCALGLKPNYTGAMVNLGNVLKDSGRLDDAVTVLSKAISIEPSSAEACNNLGIALVERGQPAEATAAFNQAIRNRPAFVSAHCNLIYSMNYHPNLNQQMAAQELVRWNRQHADPLRKSIAAHSNNRDPDRRLRIGYVSSDLNRHPVGRFLLPLLEHHDKTQVEVFAYAQVRVPDETTQQLRSFIDVWRNILGLSDAATAELIRQDQIDIMVDLAGHTSSNRLLVFAQKPAPVQVSYLGYPASTGLSTIAYRLTDALADPPGMTESRYSERLLRLPHCAWCYQPAASTPPIGDLPAIRNGHITFGSFNNFSKVNEPLLEWWAEILRQVPGSRMLLKAKSFAAESVQQKVRNAFLCRGITTDRLTLYPFVQANDHLGMYGQVDIALDTFPYHGTTTTCEALWMGVPVITLAGQAHVSRVGVSLLTHAGMPEWIAADADEYVFKAIQLANDLPALTNIRLKIREQMMQSPLMDAATFARNIETACRQIWRSWTESSLK